MQGSSAEKLHILIAADDCVSFSVSLLIITLNMLSWVWRRLQRECAIYKNGKKQTRLPSQSAWSEVKLIGVTLSSCCEFGTISSSDHTFSAAVACQFCSTKLNWRFSVQKFRLSSQATEKTSETLWTKYKTVLRDGTADKLWVNWKSTPKNRGPAMKFLI